MIDPTPTRIERPRWTRWALLVVGLYVLLVAWIEPFFVRYPPAGSFLLVGLLAAIVAWRRPHGSKAAWVTILSAIISAGAQIVWLVTAWYPAWALALGFALATQVQQTQQQGLEQLREDELVRILDDVSQDAARLGNDARALEVTRDRLLSGADSSAEATAFCRNNRCRGTGMASRYFMLDHDASLATVSPKYKATIIGSKNEPDTSIATTTKLGALAVARSMNPPDRRFGLASPISSAATRMNGSNAARANTSWVRRRRSCRRSSTPSRRVRPGR